MSFRTSHRSPLLALVALAATATAGAQPRAADWASGFASPMRIHWLSSSRSRHPRFLRRRGRRRDRWCAAVGHSFDIVEGQCVQGELVEAVDEHGNAIFEHAPPPDDGRVRLGR